MNKNLGIKWYKTIDSTNSQAARELDNAPEGSVWVADFQTAGKGQRGNKWESKEGENLTFSILFRPRFLSPANQFSISIAASTGICRYLASKGIEPKIKWPNDIYIGDRKICGMLIEHSISGDKLAGSIVGIGLNLNQEKFSSNAPNPTSLAIELGLQGKPFNCREELPLLLGYLCTAYTELQEGFYNELRNEYLQHLYRFGQFHKYIELNSESRGDMPVEKIAGGREITARIIGIDDYGCAVVEHSTGEIKSYPFKGIRYVI